jgi:class 3 adenylate cyclase
VTTTFVRETGIDLFLARFCPNAPLIREVLTKAERLRPLNDGEVLCEPEAPAYCFWIVDHGDIDVRLGPKIVRRSRGDLIGEAAFYRANDAAGPPLRGAGMVANGAAAVWEIDISDIGDMTVEQQACWHETVGRCLTAKLDDATSQRRSLLEDKLTTVQLLRRFVCDEGLHAAYAALNRGVAEPIKPVRTSAIVWFSDLVGFSTYAKDADPSHVAEVLRELLNIQAEAIVGAGGQIDKTMGDGLMGFWRVPDLGRTVMYAPKAVQAALEASNRIRATVEAKALPLDVRIGLHLGEAIMGDFGASDRIGFTLVGETVNSAARYEQARASTDGGSLGRVRVSDVLFSHLSEEGIKAHFHGGARELAAKGDRVFTAYVSLA